MSFKSPKYSIIVPAHNEEKFIGECLTSILMQSFSDYEILMIADRCSDHTASIARSMGVDPIEVDAGSLGSARNCGIEVARGEYILFLDADDYYLTSSSLQTIDFSLGEKKADVLAFGFMMGTKLSHVLRRDGNLWPNVWSKAWRRKIFGALRFGEMIAEDVDWNRRAYPLIDSLEIVDLPLIQYRYPRKGSITDRVLKGEIFWGESPFRVKGER